MGGAARMMGFFNVLLWYSPLLYKIFKIYWREKEKKISGMGRKRVAGCNTILCM